MLDLSLFLLFSVLSLLFGNIECFFIIFLIFHYLRSFLLPKTTLYHSSSQFAKSVLSSCPSFHTGYQPTFWLYNALAHITFEATFGNLYKYDFLCAKISYKREIVQQLDGGVLAIDWAGPKASKSKKILLIGPGITGDSSEQYVRHLGLEAIGLGYTIGVLTGRGVSGLPIKVRDT